MEFRKRSRRLAYVLLAVPALVATGDRFKLRLLTESLTEDEEATDSLEEQMAKPGWMVFRRASDCGIIPDGLGLRRGDG